MLIEIKIPKEIREYRESIFFGLTTRQFICSLLALGGGLRGCKRLSGASNRTSVPALLAGGPEARQAVGVYFLLQPYVGTEEIGWMCILAAVPFAACGFFRYHFKKQEVSPRKRSSKNRIPNSPGRQMPSVSPKPP